LLSNFALECIIKNAQGNTDRKTSLLICADDVNILHENVRKKNTEAPLIASNEFAPEIDAEENSK
jgi:hypothetical protein